MTKRTLISISCAMLLATLSALSPALAHEFILKPVQMNVDVGHQLPFSVLSAHVFMVSEEVEPLEQVDTYLLDGGSRTDITLKANDMLLTLDGQIPLENPGTKILCGHRKGMIWTQTAQGWKQAGKQGLSGVISSGKYEKFCKALIVAGKADEGYKAIVGHKLEIVPLDDPATVLPGKDLAVQVLLDGQPLATEVYASYDGFTSTPNTYAYFTETDGEGIAQVKITHPGTWMVRAQYRSEEPTPDYDTHVIRAILVFSVD